MAVIASTRHPLVQTLKRLGEHRRPDPEGRILLDGPRLIEAAIEARVPIEAALLAADATPRSQDVAARLRDGGIRVHGASPRAVQAVSRVTTTQGLVAVARCQRPAEIAVLDATSLIVLVADRIQDPGNIGTMIRSAVAAGATALAITEGTADPYQPKVLRATMGAAFHLPILTIPGDALRAALAARSVRVLVADPSGPLSYTDAPVDPPIAVVVGNEAAGPDPAWATMGTRVRIPLRGPVESLNVAVAAALLLYEVARRGRRHGGE